MAGLTLLLLAFTPAPFPAPPPAPAPEVTHTEPADEDRWPGAHTFGLRAGLGGGTASAGVEAGNVGATYLLTDSLALSGDLGLGVLASSSGGTATMAIDALMAIYLGEPSRSLRPYIGLLFGVGIDTANRQATAGSSQSQGAFQLAFGAGVGAEYWLSKHFSLGAELMFRILLTNFEPLVAQLGTLTPGLRATYYF